MKNLAEDRDEVTTDAERRWITRARRERGITADEGTCWFVETVQRWTDGRWDQDMKWLGSSPGDALAFAQAYAGYGRRDGTGRWTLEVFGEVKTCRWF